MHTDIRDRHEISHEDVMGLNFIRRSCPYVFRRHFRQGLRSHIMEVLDPSAVETETTGTLVDGLLRFPAARPIRMLRIFRTRFRSPELARLEIQRLKILEKYLPQPYFARSQEFFVDYAAPGSRDILLCGLQDYVEGKTIDPWNFHPDKPAEASGLVRHLGIFVRSIRKMALDAGLIPDLAGVGNLLLTVDGALKLVDINNISRIPDDGRVYLDEKGYPVVDKSIEALSMLERRVLGRPVERNDPLYRIFLDPVRMSEVVEIEKRFGGKKASGEKAWGNRVSLGQLKQRSSQADR